jgi:hypothetical protein
MYAESGNSKYSQLHQLEGQLSEALGLLKDVVETIREVEPSAVAAIKAEVLKIFNDDE